MTCQKNEQVTSTVVLNPQVDFMQCSMLNGINVVPLPQVSSRLSCCFTSLYAAFIVERNTSCAIATVGAKPFAMFFTYRFWEAGNLDNSSNPPWQNTRSRLWQLTTVGYFYLRSFLQYCLPHDMQCFVLLCFAGDAAVSWELCFLCVCVVPWSGWTTQLRFPPSRRQNIFIQTDKLNQNLKSSSSHGEFASNMCQEIFYQASNKFLIIANSLISHLKHVSICIFLLPPPPSTRMPLLSHAGLSKQDYGWKDYYRLSSTGRHGLSFPARGACGS